MSAVEQRDWRQDWRDLEWMTDDDLRAAMEHVPDELREKLAEGPKPYRYGCGVCDAFAAVLGARWAKEFEADATDPLWQVYGYHEVPKAQMFRAPQQWYGPLANDTYVRCLATYRAAGWDGEAPEPNA